jgi:bifunctional DNase/RNase
MVQVQVLQVGPLPDQSGYLLLLKSRDDERVLPITIGHFEAVSIAMGVGGVTTPRPMPYELLQAVITRLGGTLQQVVIHDVRDKAFIGQLEISTKNGVIEVDCRPSDGIALAVRSECPIWVTDEVMEQAATTLPPDADVGAAGVID